jgi:serine/threonine protein kinase
MAEPVIQLVAQKHGQNLANFGLEPGDYLIGRDPACSIAIDSPEISRKHAKLHVAHDHFTIEDVGGRFGTHIDGQQIVGAVTIQPGQTITLGRTTIELLPVDPSQSIPVAQSTQLERYERVRQLAKGGMGEVHLAFDRQLQRHIALKVMTPEIAASPELSGRFTQEAIVLGRLDHPHIVPIHDLGTDPEGRNYYAMRFVRGTTLKEVLTGLRKGQPKTVDRYPLARLLEIFQKICDAVGYAHSKGIIHRDLKPANIMIGEFGEVMVMDWGIAKILNQSETTPATVPLGTGSGTQYGTVMGTPSFMAPEQAEGRLDAINERTDIYSLGAILYNILTLRAPITGEGANADLMERVKAGQITPPTVFNTDSENAAVLLHCPDRQIPDAVSAVAMQALALEPSHRYHDVSELQRDIAAYAAGYAPVAEHAGAFRQFRLTLRRNATLTVATSIIALLIVGFGILAHLKNRELAETVAHSRQAAPTSYHAAGQLMTQGLFQEALATSKLATKLNPNKPEHWHRLARVQLAMQKPAATLQSLKKAGEANKFTTQAVQLCDRLTQAYGTEKLPLHGMTEVFHWQYGRGMNMDARYTLFLMEVEKTNAWRTAQTEVKRLGLSGRVKQDSNGYLDLNLAGTKTSNLKPFARLPVYRLNLWQVQVADLSALSQMPLRELYLSYSSVRNLLPLRTRPLRTLTIAFSPVESIEPLSDMPLVHLKLSSTQVKNLTPLANMPLQTLHLDRTPVTNLEPLAGLPIRELRLDGCKQLRDLTPLAQCTNLEVLTLPRTHGKIEFLKNLPKLKRISYHYDSRDPKKVEPATQFWRTLSLASHR